MAVERRTFLKGSAAVTGGALLAGPFQGLVAGPAAGLGAASFRPCARPRTCATARCGCTCPRASPTGPSTTPSSRSTLDDGTALPGRHDGMGAFGAEGGNVTSSCATTR